MLRRKLLSSKAVAAVSLAVCASIGTTTAQAQTQNSVWTNGGSDSNWSTAANWSPTGDPNNNSNGFTDYNVTIGAPSPTNVNSGFTIDSMAVGTAGLVNILEGESLTVNGPTLSNNGSIIINSSAVAAQTALVVAAGSVSGSGMISLNDGGIGNAARLDGNFTQLAGHTINGAGNINATLTNSGIINGNSTAGSLNITGAVMNNNLIEATGGGAVAIFGTVTGGTLSTTNGGVIEGFNGGTISNLTNQGTMSVPESNEFSASGTITDNGTITINPTATIAQTGLMFNSGTVGGTGAITLEDGGVGNAARLDGSLTQNAGHTINGDGNVNANITNNGTIDGNSTGNALFLNGTITNTDLLRSSNAGTLAIVGTVSGGTLNTATGGVIAGLNNGTMNNLTNLGALVVPEDNEFFATGTITDNGTITINPTAAIAQTGLTFSGGTVSGTGTITLNDGGVPNAARLDGTLTLTQSAGHTINGAGNVNTAITNDGIIDGNSTVGPLYLNGNVNNTNGVLQSTGGVLAINGSTITGGIFQTSSGGVIQGLNGGTIIGITNKGALSIPGGNVLNATGTITDNGLITINPTGLGAVTSLTCATGTTISGNGTITLNGAGNGNAAHLEGTLTQSAGHTIDGNGNVDATITNNGVIDGDSTVASLNLLGNVANNNLNDLVESTNGGVLALAGTTVTGGTLRTAGGGIVEAASGYTSTIASLTNQGTLDLTGGAILDATGAISDNGVININPTGIGALTSLDFMGGTVSGTGTIALNGAGNGNASRLDGTLTQSTGHSIVGNGNLNATLTNNGVVNANSTGLVLNLVSNDTNNNLMEATNGGTLNISNLTITQGAGGVISASGSASGTASVVNLSSSTITDGMASTSTGGTLFFSSGGSTLTGSVANNGTVSVQTGNSTSPVLISQITGGGNVNVGSNGYLRIVKASTAGSVSVNSGALDLTTSKLAINFGANPDPIKSIVGLLASGYNSATWTGGGITSSAAAANPGQFALGYADGNVDTQSTAAPNQVLIKYALVGDTNLDGTVNLTDLLTLLNSYGQTGRDWAQGDFNYDFTVNLTDLLGLLNDYGQSVQSSSIASTQVVPEPATFSLLAMGAAGLMARRRVRI